MRLYLLLVSFTAAAACAGHSEKSVAGDWDAYLASGSSTNPGFTGWRRMGFAHFERRDSGVVGSIRRRTGESLVDQGRVATRADSVVIDGAHDQSISGAWHGDTLTGVLMAGGKPAGRRIRLVRRTSPFTVEQNYALWPG